MSTVDGLVLLVATRLGDGATPRTESDVRRQGDDTRLSTACFIWRMKLAALELPKKPWVGCPSSTAPIIALTPSKQSSDRSGWFGELSSRGKADLCVLAVLLPEIFCGALCAGKDDSPAVLLGIVLLIPCWLTDRGDSEPWREDRSCKFYQTTSYPRLHIFTARRLNDKDITDMRVARYLTTNAGSCGCRDRFGTF